ncbi:MAG TPA: PRC-barrel domain-containing protein [Chloroflexota bacterium]
MRLTELRGLPVIDPTAARKIGIVADYQVDPGTGRLAALDLSRATDAAGERVEAHRIRRVGSSAVILTARGSADPGGPVEVNEHWLDGSTLVGLEVLGDDGERIGELVDATFDQDSLEIVTYLLAATFIERLLRQRGRVQPSRVHACSRELMLVSTGRMQPQPESLAATSDETMPLSLRIPLKDADRVSLPAMEQAPDGQTVSASKR